MTRVTAPSRLHFGLFHVPTHEAEPGVRSFGGVGLMIDEPNTIITVRPADSWQVEGALASRAQAFAQRFVSGLPDADRQAFQILVERCPPEHVGLGVGTQLGLAVAKGVAAEVGFPNLTAADLAQRVGRGERSAVGIHGFDRGGFLVEAGKLPGEAVSPLVAQYDFPEAWRVIVAIPPSGGNWSGERERCAFERAKHADDGIRTTERLTRIALLGMIPALVAEDLPAFGEAVHEFNRLAGEPFAAAQGGPYAGTEVEELIATLRQMGLHGVGQSSWGPSVFAIVGDEAEARAVSLAIRNRGAKVQTIIAKVNRGGAVVERDL